MMNQTIITSDGIELNTDYHRSDSSKGMIIIFHGMGEHSGRYVDLTKKLNEIGFSVVSFDHRGHGRSGGKRGHTPSYDLLMDDIKNVVDFAENLEQDKPIFVFSQSMGANLALNYMIRRKDKRIKGVVASSPYLKLAFNPPKWKVALGKMAAGIYPALTQRTGLEVEAISRDKSVIEKYQNDPLVHDKITASFFVQVHQAGPYAIDHINEIECPVLVLHGTADRLTSHIASEELAKNAKGNVQLKIYSDCYHELHHEEEKKEVFNEILDWIKNLELTSK
jgi:acylglycerol lipase